MHGTDTAGQWSTHGQGSYLRYLGDGVSRERSLNQITLCMQQKYLSLMRGACTFVIATESALSAVS